MGGESLKMKSTGGQVSFLSNLQGIPTGIGSPGHPEVTEGQQILPQTSGGKKEQPGVQTQLSAWQGANLEGSPPTLRRRCLLPIAALLPASSGPDGYWPLLFGSKADFTFSRRGWGTVPETKGTKNKHFKKPSRARLTNLNVSYIDTDTDKQRTVDTARVGILKPIS